jgi:hypothetical protein
LTGAATAEPEEPTDVEEFEGGRPRGACGAGDVSRHIGNSDIFGIAIDDPTP